MSTRSRISIQLSDDSILSVYHHWDGYPEWLGKTLMSHYNNRELVEDLIDGGDMSCCWTTQRWNDSDNDIPGPNYYSYRGEDCPPRHDETLEDFLSDGEEYAYVFTLTDEWICYDLHGETPQQIEIPDAVTI